MDVRMSYTYSSENAKFRVKVIIFENVLGFKYAGKFNHIAAVAWSNFFSTSF